MELNSLGISPPMGLAHLGFPSENNVDPRISDFPARTMVTRWKAWGRTEKNAA